MEKTQIEARLEKLIAEQEQRQKQVAEWNEQIARLNQAIAQTKEAHDFVRGQIAGFHEILNDEKKAEETKAETVVVSDTPVPAAAPAKNLEVAG